MDEENEVIKENSTNSEKQLNICALLSFIFSLVGLFVFGFPLGIAAIILGIIGIVKSNKEKQNFKWMAIVGLVLGSIDIIAILLSVVALYSIIA